MYATWRTNIENIVSIHEINESDSMVAYEHLE